MARRSRYVAAPPGAVWQLLTDGYSYAGWVVGAHRIRAVDPGFPAAGSRLHYSVGTRWVHLDDHTRVLDLDAATRRIELEARALPLLGSARIRVQVQPSGDGSLVVLDEWPQGGLARLLRAPLVAPLADRLVAWRNAEALRRLARLAESRVAGPGERRGRPPVTPR